MTTKLNGLDVDTPTDVDWHKSTGLTLVLHAPRQRIVDEITVAAAGDGLITVVDPRVCGLFRMHSASDNVITLALVRQVP